MGGKVGAAETEATYAFLADEVPGVSGEINDQTYTFTVVGGVTELTAAKADIFEKAGVKDVEASKAEFIADGRMPAVRESIRRSKAVDHLVENAKVTEVDETAKDAE